MWEISDRSPSLEIKMWIRAPNIPYEGLRLVTHPTFEYLTYEITAPERFDRRLGPYTSLNPEAKQRWQLPPADGASAFRRPRGKFKTPSSTQLAALAHPLHNRLADKTRICLYRTGARLRGRRLRYGANINPTSRAARQRASQVVVRA